MRPLISGALLVALPSINGVQFASEQGVIVESDEASGEQSREQSRSQQRAHGRNKKGWKEIKGHVTNAWETVTSPVTEFVDNVLGRGEYTGPSWNGTHAILAEAKTRADDAMKAVDDAIALMKKTEKTVQTADKLQGKYASAARKSVDSAAIDAAKSAIIAERQVVSGGLSLTEDFKNSTMRESNTKLLEDGGLGAYAQFGDAMKQDDFVGMTFMVACAMMLAATLFLFIEKFSVPKQWEAPLMISSLVTGIAFWNYVYMRQVWLESHVSPLTYRYCDWFVTVPMQIMEFYFVLAAGGLATPLMFWNLLVASFLMILFGYIGEAMLLNNILSFALSCICWFYVIGYTFMGAPGRALTDKRAKPAHIQAFTNIRLIVAIGWVIYPIGYCVGFGWFNFAIKAAPAQCLAWLNGIYNIADLVNKVAFGLAIYAAAKSDDEPVKGGGGAA